MKRADAKTTAAAAAPVTKGKEKKKGKENYRPTRNACKLCAPLGAALAFKGFSKTIPFLHGSQGCATYIRRYLISHYREPVDIAASNFSEEAAIFGGQKSLLLGLENVCRQYRPEMIGLATTCLSETIGDNVPMFLKEYRKGREDGPPVVHVSTPSYRGTHAEGFHEAVRAVVESLATAPETPSREGINLFPGMVSPADIRHLKEIFKDFETEVTILPDISETLDGHLWSEYIRMPEGGTPIQKIRGSGRARASIEFGRVLSGQKSAGKSLEERARVQCFSLGLPIGVSESDRLFQTLSELTGHRVPERYNAQRERLLDAYVDGHKYVSGARAILYGEEDLVIGLAAFLSEIGITPVLCASGSKSGLLKEKLSQVTPDISKIQVEEGADFSDIEEIAAQSAPDIFIGSSKGYRIARALNLPLVRAGFPIHDRIGGPRIIHLGYQGAQALFDRIANALIEKRQSDSKVGYGYM